MFVQEGSSREGVWLWRELPAAAAAGWRWGADLGQGQSPRATGAGRRALGSYHTYSGQHTTTPSTTPTSTRDSKVRTISLILVKLNACTSWWYEYGIQFYIFRYVSDVLGGSVERSGPLGYELPAGYIQLDQKSNLVPLGQIKLGVFQQRTLLFKVGNSNVVSYNSYMYVLS